MKRQKNTKSNLLAIAYFALMLVVSTVAAHAQGDSLAASPLLRTTGPNVLGAGHLMWSGDINAYYLNYKADETRPSKYTLTSANTGLRWGIGNRAELTLGFSVLHAAGTLLGDTMSATNTFTPSIGARLQLYEGKGWVPTVTFFTDLTMPIYNNHISDSSLETLVEPVIGLQLRSRLGERFYLDGSIGYAWNRETTPYVRSIDGPVRYSLTLHWLTCERHMLSIGWGNQIAHLESTWQVRDNFQLKAKLNIAAGFAKGGTGVFQIHGLVGFNWMLR